MRAGFTLVEVLVALAIFALVAVGGVTMLSLVADNQTQVSARLQELARFERARALLAGDLSQIANRPARGLDGIASAPFSARSGAQDGVVLAFVRRGWDNPDGRARASIQYVEYALVQGRLERRSRPMADGSPLGPPATVLEGVASLEIVLRDALGDRPITGQFRGLAPAAIELRVGLERFGELRMVVLATASG